MEGGEEGIESGGKGSKAGGRAGILGKGGNDVRRRSETEQEGRRVEGTKVSRQKEDGRGRREEGERTRTRIRIIVLAEEPKTRTSSD